ncbi:prenyltransferase [Halobaculum sp. MBLA0143]|uniref:prenyltransferase n=1 Tax=Halobaculum sp. MBLA0143 TaxID=3079933 RepID=UPI003523AD85
MSAATTTHGAALPRLRYLLKLSRPRFWPYLAGPVVVGVAGAAASVPELFAPLNFLLFGFFLVPANVQLYGVNDVFDADVDEDNPKKDDKEVRYGGDRLVPAAVTLTSLAGLALFALVPRVAWPYLAAYFLLAVEYSAPPFRFKTTPFLDSVSNGLYILPGAVAYATVTGTHPPASALVGGWLWSMGMHTFSAIPDIEPDREAGIRTTATVLGEERTYAYCAATWLASGVAFAFLDTRIALPLLAYPVVVFGIYWSDVPVDRAYWWYPALNTLVGALLTMGLLTRIVPPEAVLP